MRLFVTARARVRTMLNKNNVFSFAERLLLEQPPHKYSCARVTKIKSPRIGISNYRYASRECASRLLRFRVTSAQAYVLHRYHR